MSHELAQQLEGELRAFVSKYRFTGKGPLCVALVMTAHARSIGLPLDPAQLLTEGGGQVFGLGKSAVQSVLSKWKINRVLAEEGGRTSRGSISNMRAYVGLLNDMYMRGIADLDLIEAFWIARVNDYFAAKPFKLNLDHSRGLRSVIRDLMRQAHERQKAIPGTQYAGAVLQHLVGAKLDMLGLSVEHNSFSTSDEQSGRVGDFHVGDVAIHVTTSPGEAVIRKCKANLERGLQPVLVTTYKQAAVAEGLAEQHGIGERIDVLEAEQFLASNIHEHSRFSSVSRKGSVGELVGKYNALIENNETDPSLRIEFKS